jgi:hypothetical protein
VSAPCIVGADRHEPAPKADAFCRCWCSRHAPVRSSRHFAGISSLQRNAVLVSTVSSCREQIELSGVAFARVSVRSLFGLPPNNRVNRTAHQRRCACWWVPSSLRSSAAGYAEPLGGTMTECAQLQCRHHASHKPIDMTTRRRHMHFAAAGPIPERHIGPPGISPASLRFNGMRCSSVRFHRCEPPQSGVAFARVSMGVFWRLPPNHRVNRTAHQRRCACWWVPSALRAPAASYAER